MDIVAHHRWESLDTTHGAVFFWVGRRLCEASYRIDQADLLLFGSVGPCNGDTSFLSEVGFNLEGCDSHPTEKQVEAFVAESLLPLLVMAIDGK